MWRFEQKVSIRRPVQHVFRMYTDHARMPAWQPGLLEIEEVSGTPGRAGAVSKLRYQFGRRKMIMTETVVEVVPPNRYVVTYALKGLRHTVSHSFTAKGSGETEWVAVSEYRFRGLMWLLGRSMRGGLEEQGRILMGNFKGYVESGAE
jgi:uncharacterized protein YndB with AHSA1/START domain